MNYNSLNFNDNKIECEIMNKRLNKKRKNY